MDTSRRRLLALAGTTALAAPLGGCGTLLYPERRGQTGGRIDPSVAILNGIGLLLFIVPGLIAFAVDFGSGAIYLPGTRADAGDSLKTYRYAGDLTEEKFDRAYEREYGQARDWHFEDAQRIEVSDVEEMHRKLAAVRASGMVRI